MGRGEDNRQKILLSDLIDEVAGLCRGKRLNYILKMESVVMALASLGKAKLGNIVEFITEHNLKIGKDGHKEVIGKLKFLIDHNIVQKNGVQYQLTYQIMPLLHLENIKIYSARESRFMSDLFDRISRLRLADFTLKEPVLTLSMNSLLLELRIYLGNLKGKTDQDTAIRIDSAIKRIDAYQELLNKYYHDKEKPRDENITFNQLEESVTDLYGLSFKKKKKAIEEGLDVQIELYGVVAD